MGKARILVAENEGLVAKDIAATLQSMGYAVAGTVATGEAALQKAAETRPDIVLMDVSLGGGIDGIETAERIRRLFGIPVVFLTAYADAQTLRRASVTNPFGFVIKPYGDKELQASIEIAIYRREMEAQLRERQEWFATTLRCIGEGVITTDTAGHVSFLNPMAETLTGWKLEETAGHALSDVFVVLDEASRTPVPLPAPHPAGRRAAAAHASHRILLRSRTGTETPIESTASPIRSATGADLGSVVVFRDMTLPRVMERQILNKQEMEAIGKLAGSLAHEFSTFIGIISGHASSALENLLPSTRAHEDVSRIIAAARHANELTRRVLSVARASAPQMELKVEPVSAAEVIRNAVALVRTPFVDRGIAFRVREPEHPLWVMADSAQILDVLMDLFFNAADAMPSGGTITVDAIETTARPPADAPAAEGRTRKHVMIRVRDTGAGMSHDVIERLFEPFFTTKSGRGNIGLGLSMAQAAVQRCGGWIKVLSKPGHGTSFRVYLPRARPASLKAGRATEAVLRSATVLVVDDREELLAETRRMLEKEGFSVISAHGGEAAAPTFRTHADEIDVAVVDMVMPGRSGRQVVEDILNTDPNIRVIVTSGFSRDYARSVLAPGPWSFLQKPYDHDQLLAAIRRALSPRTA